MAKREQHQWAVYNLAIIGRNPEIFNSKEEALKFAYKDSLNPTNPFIKIDEDNKWIDYRGNVYL